MAKLEPRSTSLAESRDLAANGLQQDPLEGSSAGWPGWLRLWGGSPFKYPGGNLPSNPKGRINTSEALKPAGFSHGISRGMAGAFFILGYAHHSPAIRCASGDTAKFLNAGADPTRALRASACGEYFPYVPVVRLRDLGDVRCRTKEKLMPYFSALGERGFAPI